jgi:hypothetical protein
VSIHRAARAIQSLRLESWGMSRAAVVFTPCDRPKKQLFDNISAVRDGRDALVKLI